MQRLLRANKGIYIYRSISRESHVPEQEPTEKGASSKMFFTWAMLLREPLGSTQSGRTSLPKRATMPNGLDSHKEYSWPIVSR